MCKSLQPGWSCHEAGSGHELAGSHACGCTSNCHRSPFPSADSMFSAMDLPHPGYRYGRRGPRMHTLAELSCSYTQNRLIIRLCRPDRYEYQYCLGASSIRDTKVFLRTNKWSAFSRLGGAIRNGCSKRSRKAIDQLGTSRVIHSKSPHNMAYYSDLIDMLRRASTLGERLIRW